MMGEEIEAVTMAVTVAMIETIAMVGIVTMAAIAKEEDLLEAVTEIAIVTEDMTA